MKRTVCNTLISLCLVALGQAGLKAQTPVTFDIPFAFTAGAKVLPAGHYVVEQKPWVLTLRGIDNRSAVMILTHMGEPNKDRSKDRATFQKYGNIYILSEVASPQYGSVVPKSRLAKELIARESTRKTTIELASALQ